MNLLRKLSLAPAPQMRDNDGKASALLREVLAYHHGKGEYDFSHVKQPHRDQAAFDAWQDLRQRIIDHLAEANDPES